MFVPHDFSHSSVLPCEGVGTKVAAESLQELIDGRFRVQSLIVETRNSTVYAGTDLLTEQPVAVKVLQGDVQLPLAASIVKAARTLKRNTEQLDPGIIRIVEVCEWRGQTVVISPLFGGVTLQEFVARQDKEALEADEALHILSAVAKAVDSAWQRGIVHGDLSPCNILIDPATLDVKVTDFGGVGANQDGGSIAQSGSLSSRAAWAFTPDFCAPEVRRGRTPDERSEVFSLGAILYWTIFGEPPSGFADQWEQIEGLPDAIRKLLRSTLCRAAKRYDLAELIAAVEAAIRGHALGAVRRALPIITTHNESTLGLPFRFQSSQGRIGFRLVGDGESPIGQHNGPALQDGGATHHNLASQSFFVSDVLSYQQVTEILGEAGGLARSCNADRFSAATVEYSVARQIGRALRPARLISEREFECLVLGGNLCSDQTWCGIWTRSDYRADWLYRVHYGPTFSSPRRSAHCGSVKTVRGRILDSGPDSWMTSRTPVWTRSAARFGIILVLPAHPKNLYIEQTFEERPDV